jgi:hypothetical protein
MSKRVELVSLPKPIEDALAVSRKKSADYNGIVGRASYFPFGMVSYAQMIHIKSTRLVNLVASEAAPNFESVRDTCIDLINYACFLAEAADEGDL